MSSDVFLGLVTYPRTRFPESSGPNGLIAQVQEGLRTHEVSVETSVSGEDLYTDDMLPLNRDEVLRSISAELIVERQWRQFLAGREEGTLTRINFGARRLSRRLRLAPPWRRELADSDLGPRGLRRLINIELAHIELLRIGITSGAKWILVVEDDARLENRDAFVGGLIRLLNEALPAPYPKYINVSRSFDQAALGVEHLLTHLGSWDATGQIGIEGSARPFTNTVCAVLYRADFARQLLATYQQIPLSPVLPIDWKLNKAILILMEGGELGPGDCWALGPAPIAQGSMH